MTTSTTTAPKVATVPLRPRRRWIKYGAALILALLAWAAFDLYAPRRTSMREFDADEVARLETAMWRSYYSRQRVKLFGELAELLRTQYRLPLLRSNAVAYRAAKAAFVFKAGTGDLSFPDPGDDPVARLKPLKDISALYGTLDDLYPGSIRILK